MKKIGIGSALLALALIGYAHQALAGCSVSLGSIQKIGYTTIGGIPCTRYRVEAQAQSDGCYCQCVQIYGCLCNNLTGIGLNVQGRGYSIGPNLENSTSCYETAPNYSESNYVRDDVDIVVCPPGDELIVTARQGTLPGDTQCDSQKFFLKAECPPDQCCETNTSSSINVVSGRSHTPPQTDFILKGTGQEWPFTRYYYTQWAQRATLLGNGWSYNLASWLDPEYSDWKGAPNIENNRRIRRRIVEGNGRSLIFTKSGSEYLPSLEESSRLIQDGTGWKWTRADGPVYRFQDDGKLDYIEAASGSRLDLDYSMGNAVTMTDYPSGRSASIQMADNRIDSIAVGSHAFQYHYDGNNLVSVSDGATMVSYEYEGLANYYNLKKVLNKNGEIVEQIFYTGDRVNEVQSANSWYGIQYSNTITVGRSTMTDYTTGRQNNIYYDKLTRLITSADECLAGCSAGGQGLGRLYDGYGNRILERHGRDALSQSLTFSIFDGYKNLLTSIPLQALDLTTLAAKTITFDGPGPNPLELFTASPMLPGQTEIVQRDGVLSLKLNASPINNWKVSFTSKDLITLTGNFELTLHFKNLVLPLGLDEPEDHVQRGLWLQVRTPQETSPTDTYIWAGRNETNWIFRSKSYVSTVIGDTISDVPTLSGMI